MLNSVSSIFGFLALGVCLAGASVSLAAPTPDKPAAPYIVLKLDDMVADKNGDVPERWQRILDFSAERKIKVSIGIICNSLEGDKPKYVEGLKTAAAGGLVEFWHHGYDHAKWTSDGVTRFEFQHSGRAHQQEHFDRAQALAKEKLGITFTTFGAPYNATDDDTTAMLAEQADIRVWLYAPKANLAGKFVAGRGLGVNIEQPVHRPNLAALVAGYENGRKKAPAYYVIQGHPMSWDDAAFAEFVAIIDYLAAQGCMFVLPEELPGLLK